MDQNKIGAFITKLRKEKKMTQQELADKLNVTDRAISNWENGRRMPDVSIFKSLCEVLDISVNELINGEKIAKEKVVKTSDTTIIKALNINKRNQIKSQNIIKVLFTLVIILSIFYIFSIVRRYHKEYPYIDAYSVIVYLSDDNFKLNKMFTYSYHRQNIDIYYYGIELAQICDSKDNCYELKSALNHQQIDIDEIKKYMESQFALGNTERYTFYDGGTTTYQNERYSIMFCNTTEGNKDIYIGESDMVENLNGYYCGRSEYSMKSYIRTYEVISAKINKEDPEYIDVTLKRNNGEMGTVLIHNSNNLVVGQTYEFSFMTFDKFEDTIENIFKYSTFLKATESDNLIAEHINEEIYINEDLDNGAELNDLDHVTMTIKEGTLTKTGATIIITDYSGHKYIYGSPFKLEKKTNGLWQDVHSNCTNCAFDMIAYGVDQDGKLEMDQNWKYLYGELSSGRYRLVKDANLKSEIPITENTPKHYFSVEFDIE